MGVMQCARNGCDNILCDRYSKEYGYICNECFEELVEKQNAQFCSIHYFMSMPKLKRLDVDYRPDLEEEFRRI